MTTPTVSIYSSPACKYCNHAKDLFKANNIAYTEFNVAEDAVRRDEMINMTGQRRIPVMVINEEVLVGFSENEARLKELLSIK